MNLRYILAFFIVILIFFSYYEAIKSYDIINVKRIHKCYTVIAISVFNINSSRQIKGLDHNMLPAVEKVVGGMDWAVPGCIMFSGDVPRALPVGSSSSVGGRRFFSFSNKRCFSSH